MTTEPAIEPRRSGSQGPAPHLVVGLGASAGGMQALTQFFEAMPVPNGMAFVVVMHLAPDHASHATEILQRATVMPVAEITERMPIEPDRVYMIPPAHTLSMESGYLLLQDDRRMLGRSATIDLFFRALAEAHRHHAVAVVLSGTGTDGSVGLTRMKEMGGVTLAQAPEDAQHTGMPESAIATGLVDHVLPVAEMPGYLMKLAALVGRMRLPADVAPRLNAVPISAHDEAKHSEAALAEIMTVLRTRTRHDFRHYKRPTVLRRLERRMQVTGMPDLPSYRDHLVANESETRALLQDMLISVTNFFRDREAFDALERDVLPELLAQLGPEQGLRAWVIGCASGEEAYTVAMLLQELRDAEPKVAPFQVFASDIDENALATARAGLYPGSIVADVVPMRIRRHFTRENDHFRIAKGLRERVLFAQHNVLRDPPFSRVDLICCRNLLIYLDRAAQTAVLDVIRFALRPGGIVFLGSSESVEVAGERFEVIDKRHRIYRMPAALNDVDRPAAPPVQVLGPVPLLAAPKPDSPKRGGTTKRPTPYAELHQTATLAWSPPSVLVDTKHKILHLSEGMSSFLELQSGAPSHNLLDNVPTALRLDLRSALFRARPVGGEPARAVHFEADTDSGRLRVTVQVLAGATDGQEVSLVVFERVDGVAAAALPDTNANADIDAEAWRVQREFAAENKRLELHLQEVIERSERSTEELMSSNEELQAVNEELRSATEELETSREELQSTNEELSTVNAQLALKVEETDRVNDDLLNLVNSNDIATVFVDRAMRIKRYTPRALDLFKLLPGDVGRSLTDIANQLDYPQLLNDANEAFQSLRLVEREVSGSDDRHFVARMLPYRTTEDRIEGAILSFVDVTALKRSQVKLLASAEQLRLAAATTRDFAILTVSDQGNVTSWNRGAERLFGYSEAEIIGEPLALIFTEADRKAGAPERELAGARQHGRAEDERWHRRKDGSVFFCSGVVSRLDGALGFSKIARDLTGSQNANMARDNLLSNETQNRHRAEATMETKELFLAVMSHELKHPLSLISVNAEFLARMPEIRGVPSAARAARIIQQTVVGQARIVDDLLDLSRARTGKLRLEPEAVDWGAVTRRIVDSLQPEAQARDVRLLLETAVPPPVTMFDPLRAEQVVWNLLSNALKFTPPGGSVRATLGRQGDEACLSIVDTGRGIAPEFVDSVFNMFSQEEVPLRRGDAPPGARSGLGIGLALVRELVHAQGGRVQVRSEGVGRGSEFTVRVPLYDGVVAVADEKSDVSALAGLRLLLVDDSEDAVESFGLLLGLTGAEVQTATGGHAALALLAQEHFDLLISDTSMPQMSGPELIRTVRQRERENTDSGHGRGPIIAIACSGYSRTQDEQQAVEAGFDALIGKPATLDRVEAAVAAIQQWRGAPVDAPITDP